MAKSQQQQPDKKQLGSTTPKQDAALALPHDPDVSPGAVDVVGILPHDVHVDPDITEGHPATKTAAGQKLSHPSHPGQ